MVIVARLFQVNVNVVVEVSLDQVMVSDRMVIRMSQHHLQETKARSGTWGPSSGSCSFGSGGTTVTR